MAERPNENKDNLHATGGRPPDLTWEKFQQVCAGLALHGGKYKACQSNNLNYTTVMRAIREATDRGDDEWQELWDESYNEFKETLEQAAITRHVDGVTNPIYNNKGVLIGEETVFSDRMGELLLKGHFPERFRDKIFVSGNVGLEPVDAFANLTPKAKREIRAIIMRDLEEQREAQRLRDDPSVIEGQLAVPVGEVLDAQIADMRTAEEDEQ